MPGRRCPAHDDALPEPGTGSIPAAATDQGTRRRAGPLWLPTAAHLTATGGMAGQCEAGLSALPGGRSLAAAQAAEGAGERAASDAASGDTTERAVEHRFPADSLADGRPFRVFTVVDNVTKVSPAIAVAFSITGEAVVAVLDRLEATVGLPKRLAVDNGPEFISKALDAWAYRNGVALEFSRPGKPTDNAFVESFNGHFRQECLDQHWFASLEEARQIVGAWRIAYNTERPYQALKYGTPTEFLATGGPPEEAAD